MKITVDEQLKIAVIEPTGDLAVGISTCLFHDKVYDLLKRKINHIIVNMINTRYINSVCIGALVGGFTSTRNTGGEMKLANANDKVKLILNVTRLDQVIHIYDSLEEAVRSFEMRTV